jgi:hypothetical protein
VLAYHIGAICTPVIVYGIPVLQNAHNGDIYIIEGRKAALLPVKVYNVVITFSRKTAVGK